MCGITGVINSSSSVQKKELKKMIDSIKHRGPDGSGSFLHKNIGIGHVRLSIIDLQESSNQPLFNQDKSLVIVFNGEIYNFKELRSQLDYHYKTQSDTEVILAAYQKWGEDCLHHLKGMFSFAIYDQTKNFLFAARDRFGIKPFYYYADETTFLFSSEIKGVLASGKVKAELNNHIFYDFVVYNRTDHEGETCFKNINSLRPGHKLTYDIAKKIRN
jgi:asparagine synthase (glutamine-hydrolysing)